jgi:hypothetical protein
MAKVAMGEETAIRTVEFHLFGAYSQRTASPADVQARRSSPPSLTDRAVDGR